MLRTQHYREILFEGTRQAFPRKGQKVTLMILGIWGLLREASEWRWRLFMVISRDSGCSWGPFNPVAMGGGGAVSPEGPHTWPCNWKSVNAPIYGKGMLRMRGGMRTTLHVLQELCHPAQASPCWRGGVSSLPATFPLKEV